MTVREEYSVRLSPEEQEELQHLVRAGKSSARVTTRAGILLKTGEGWSAPGVAEALDVAEGTVYRIKRRFAEEGLAGAPEGSAPSAPVPRGRSRQLREDC